MATLSLNSQQQKAIDHSRGPLLIVAGAGTGKTTVITQSIKKLLKAKKITAENILALTFTDKAAQEMLERLDLVMPLGYQQPYLSTFHSFCDRILKAEALEIGLDPHYKILDSAHQWILIKKHLFDFPLNYYRPLGNPSKFISALLTFFSRAQDETVAPSQLLAYAKRLLKKAHSQAEKEEAHKFQELALAYKTYQDLKLAHSALDFSDLITFTLKLFSTRKSILATYQRQFRYIFIDEFQDTNYAQYQLIKLLAPVQNKPNLIVVGDDDQSIYKFRGAAISNILEFKKDYPQAAQVVLTQNYRSTPAILTAAYQLIQNNNPDRLETKLKLNKKLTSTHSKKTPTSPHIFKFSHQDDEVNWIIKKILTLVGQENYTYKDFAILTRANSHLLPFVTALKRYGIPYQLVSNRGLFDQEEVRQLIYFFQVLLNPQESQFLFQFLHNPIFSFSPQKILHYIQAAHRDKVSLYTVLTHQKDPQLKEFIILLDSLRGLIASSSPTKILFTFLSQTKYIKQFLLTESVTNQLKIQNINLFIRLLKNFETGSPHATVVELIDFLDLLQEAGENPAQAEIEDIDTIRLLTVHASKGLEFPVVFVPSLITGRFPSISRRDPIVFPDALVQETLPQTSSNTQEERRLFYVALTRAQDYLFLTHAADYDGKSKRHPSGFLQETGLPQETIAPSVTQLSLIDAPFSAPATVIDQGKPKIKLLSYSQIDTFKTCPLKYKYRYLLRVPAKPHHALSFGQSLHDTLKHFHSYELKDQKPSLKDLLYLYKQYFRPQGYDSEKHKLERFNSGKKALKKYYQVYKKQLGHPIALEKSFTLTIAGIPLIGKIDRIDQVGDSYEIIDYKTGSSKDKKQVDKDEQLSIYALGAKHALSLPVKKLSLYFLETSEKLSTQRNQKQLEATLKRLKDRVSEIKSSSFSATPGYPFPCGFCEYQNICPLAAKKK